MKVNFYLKAPKAKYETSIFIAVLYKGTRVRIYTDEKIDPRYWNLKQQRARQTTNFPTNPEFNARLGNMETKIKRAYYNWKNEHGEHLEPPPTTFANIIKSYIGKSKEKDETLSLLRTFWGYFDDFILRSKMGIRLHKGGLIAKSTIVNYNNLYNNLRKYERKTRKKIDFDSFDIHFYNQYFSYLIKLGFAKNSIGKQMANIKLILKEAYDDGFSTNTIYTHRKFKVPKETPDAIYLNNEEIQELIDLDLSENERLDKVRDAFIIGCYTGLRFSDFSQLSTNHIHDGIIEIVQTKTGNPVSIPLRQQVIDILHKYNNNFPKSISNQKFNEYLKEVCKKCPALKKVISMKKTRGGNEEIIENPKYEFISSHTARRSFATNEFLAKDIQIYQIMAITGHKTENSFYGYIRLSRDENARDIAKIWKQREEKQNNVKPFPLKAIASNQ